MAVVRDNNKWNADTLAELQALGSDDGVTSDVVAWAVDNNNWYYPDTIGASTSTWTPLATGSGATAGLEGNIYESLVGYVDPADRNSYPGTGTAVTDLEGNLTSGALAGTASYQEGAFDFTGTAGDQLSFTKGAAADDIFATGGTIIAFVRPDAAGTEGRIVDTTDALAEGYSVFVSSGASSRVYFSFRRQAATTDGEWRAADVTVPGISTVQRPLPLGAWSCITIVYDDSTPTTAPTLYLNGATIASTLISTPSGAVGSDSGNPFVIGEVSTNTNTLNGAVGPVLLFDRALAVNEVRQVMNAFASRYGILYHQPHESVIRGAESVVAGGDRTGTTSFAGALTVRGGDADDGLASGGLGPGGFLLLRGGDYTGSSSGTGGSLEIRSGNGLLSTDVDIHAGDVSVNAQAGDVTVYGGTNSGGGFPGDVIVRGGASLVSNTNSRRQGDVVVRGGEAVTDGDATTQTGNHQGGNATFRGGDGTNTANAGSVTIRAGNVDTSISNLEGGDVSITGGISTGNREGGQVNITGGINSTGSGVGGPVAVTGGVGGATGVGGLVTVTGGAGGSSSGTGGQVTVKGGAPGASGASPGAISLEGGDGNSSAGANASLTGGIGSGAFSGGVATVQGGTAGPGAAGGASTLRGGTGNTTGAGGDASVLGGTPGTTGSGGNVVITGGPGGTTSGDGGDVTLTPGSVTSGTAGSLVFDYATWPAADGAPSTVLTTDGAGNLSWATASGGASTLQEAYEGGNTIVTDATNGALDVSGTQAISLDASLASNFTVAGANLTFSTTTSGNVVASAAGDVDVDGANVLVDASTGGISLDAVTASNFTVTSVTGEALTLSTGTSGDVNLTAAGNADIDGVNVFIDASSAMSLDAAAASNFTVAGANLTLSTTASGNVVLTPATSLIFDYATWPAADGTSGQILTTNGAGALSWNDVAPSQWQEVTTTTVGTGAGSETFTLATVVQPLPTDDQTWVEIRVIGEDTTSPSTHTFFTRELRTYYRGTGATTLWSNEIVGTEQNRGFGTEITSVDLAISGNDVIVQLTMASSTRTVDWTVQYITKSTVSASSSGTSATAGQVLTFDNRGSALTTGTAAASGGTVDFTMDVGATYGEMKYLRVRTAAGTCADATVQFFRDAARTDEIYDAQNKDTSTANGWVDRNPATMMGDDGSGLASNTMYGRITNNDAGTASFDVELVFWSDGTVPGGGGVLEYTVGAVKTSAYTASAGEHVRYDASGGPFTITLPGSPSSNNRVGVVETAGSTTTLTVSGNGNNIVDPATSTVSTSATVSSAYASVIWKWDSISSVWRVE